MFLRAFEPRLQDAYFYYNTETGESSWEVPPEGTLYRLSGWWKLPEALPRGKCCVCRITDSDRYCQVCVFDDEKDEIDQVRCLAEGCCVSL